jgi:hypothetical protein
MIMPAKAYKRAGRKAGKKHPVDLVGARTGYVKGGPLKNIGKAAKDIKRRFKLS